MVHSGENRLIQSFQDGVAKIFVMYESRNLKWGIATLTTSVRYTYWYSVLHRSGTLTGILYYISQVHLLVFCVAREWIFTCAQKN